MLATPYQSRNQVAPTGDINPNVVLIDMKRRRTMNQSKSGGRGGQLLDEFKGLDSNGKPKTYRFRDAAGKRFAPTLPFDVDISTDHGKILHATFIAYKTYIDDNIIIHNPLKKAKDDIVSDDVMLDAMLVLKELRKAGDNDTLINLLRRMEGPIGRKTIDVVVANLNRLAKERPQDLLDVYNDEDFKRKVMVDKAIEAGRVIQNDRYFYYPAGVHNGRMIADGWNNLILHIQQDTDFQSYLIAAENALLNGPTPKATAASTTLSKEDKEALALLDEVDESQEEETEDGDVDNPDILTEAQIRQCVKVAISVGHLEEDGNGNYLAIDGKYRTPEEIETSYVMNPALAKALQKDLKLNGYI
jgi:hypothetical protein